LAFQFSKSVDAGRFGMERVMVDLETLGTEAGAVILSRTPFFSLSHGIVPWIE
jgi:hypothetical protein